MAALYKTAVEVAAPATHVFDYLAAVDRHVEWSGSVEFGLESMEVLDSGPVRVGTRFRSSGRNATGKPNHDLSEIVVFERPGRIGWDTTFRLGLARARFGHRYELAASPGGATLSYALASATPLNLPGWLLLLYLKHVVGKKGEAVVLSGLEAFKQACERQAVAGATAAR
jgi:hypothetical protein